MTTKNSFVALVLVAALSIAGGWLGGTLSSGPASADVSVTQLRNLQKQISSLTTASQLTDLTLTGIKAVMKGSLDAVNTYEGNVNRNDASYVAAITALQTDTAAINTFINCVRNVGPVSSC
jgi:hypothetical protein